MLDKFKEAFTNLKSLFNDTFWNLFIKLSNNRQHFLFI